MKITFTVAALSSYWKHLTDWLLYTSLYAACCTVSLAMATESLNGSQGSLFSFLHFFLFGGTLFIYNLRYISPVSFRRARSERALWSTRNKYWHLFFCLLGFLMCVAALPYITRGTILLACCAGLVSITYVLPVLPGKKQLRDRGWIKIGSLTLIWTIATSAIPLLQKGINPLAYPYELLIRFLFIFPLCIAFDVKDIHKDKASGIETIPWKMGVRNSMRLAGVSLILLASGAAAQFLRIDNIWRLAVNILMACLSYIIVHYCILHPKEKNLLGLTDGMMLLYGIFMTLLVNDIQISG